MYFKKSIFQPYCESDLKENSDPLPTFRKMPIASNLMKNWNLDRILKGENIDTDSGGGILKYPDPMV